MRDIEAQRKELLDNINLDDRAAVRYAPGSFGCHEAFHMAAVLASHVEIELLEHPSVVLNPEWFALAHKANVALFDLYQAIGAVHSEPEKPVDKEAVIADLIDALY